MTLNHDKTWWVVTVSAVCVLSAGALGGEETNWRDVARVLADRRESTSEGVVDYRYYAFQLQQAEYAELREMLRGSHGSPVPSLATHIEGWLQTSLPLEREALRGWTAFDGTLWQDRKERMPEDTVQAMVEARAKAAGVAAGAVPRLMIAHSDGVTETSIRDLRTVELKNARPGIHVLSPLDPSLHAWAEILAVDPLPEHLTPSAFVEGSVCTVEIGIAGSGDSRRHVESYSFDTGLGNAPLRASVFEGAEMELEWSFGYAEHAKEGPTRPTIVLRGEPVDSEVISVQLWVVESWQEWSSAEWLLLRKPPVHLEIDFRNGVNNETTTLRRPEYLAEVTSPEEQSRLITENILRHLGEFNPATDYNCDGITDQDDLEAAAASLK